MYDAIVLAGGAGRRLGGVDKPALDIGGRTLLDRALDAVAGAERLVVAGLPRATHTDVTWCLEDPPGGGPVAALAAAMPHVTADIVVVLAADLPGIVPAVPLLLDALRHSPADAALLVDLSGRTNHLAGAWRRRALAAALPGIAAARGVAMRSVIEVVNVELVPDSDGWGADCDTWADVYAARDRETAT